MTNIVRKTLKTTQNRLFGHMIDSIHHINTKLDVLNSEVEAVRQSQHQLNHYQLATYNELTERVRNSGVVSVSNSEIVAKIFTGQKIYLDPKDISVTPHLALDSIWEGDITLAWLAVAQPNDTIVDIGANFGYYGVIAAQKVDKNKGSVILFEANPKLIPYVNKTLSVNWLNEKAHVEQMAVADKEGNVTLNIMKDYIGSSSLLSAEHMDGYMHGKMSVIKTDDKVSVKATTLDKYCENKGLKELDLIKMDIEGFEDKAYQGMRKIVEASPNLTLFIEFTQKSYDDPEKFYNLMLQDFGHVYLINDQGLLSKPKDQSYKNVIGEPEDWLMPVFSKNPNLDKRL